MYTCICISFPHVILLPKTVKRKRNGCSILDERGETAVAILDERGETAVAILGPNVLVIRAEIVAQNYYIWVLAIF